MTTLADRLKECRTSLGINQAQLAKKAGLKNQSIIGMLETGKRMTTGHLPSIAAALGVNVLWLQFGRGDKSTGELFSTAAEPEHDAGYPVKQPEPDLLPLAIVSTKRLPPPELTADEHLVLDGFRMAPAEEKDIFIFHATRMIARYGKRTNEAKNA